MTKEQKKKWLKAIKVQIAWYESVESIDPYGDHIMCLPRKKVGICEAAHRVRPATIMRCDRCLWKLFEHHYCLGKLECSTAMRILRLRRWEKMLEKNKRRSCDWWR